MFKKILQALVTILQALVTIPLVILMMGAIWIAMVDKGNLWLVLAIKVIALTAALGLASLVKYMWTGEVRSFWKTLFFEFSDHNYE